MDGRTCDYCGDPLPSDARSDQRFCSRSHKSAARKQRRKREKIRASLVTSGIPLESPESDGGYLADSRSADHRFNAMLAADGARRTPQAQAREYAAFERRNPGVAHPGRIQDRIHRGLQTRSDDWGAGTSRFQRTANTVADAGRRARSQQLKPAPPVQSGRSQWASMKDDDPEKPGEMIDGNVFRPGHRQASAYR